MHTRDETPPTVVQDPTLAHYMGYAEYPYEETARVAERGGLIQQAEQLRYQSKLAVYSVAKNWVNNLQEQINKHMPSSFIEIPDEAAIDINHQGPLELLLEELSQNMKEQRTLNARTHEIAEQAKLAGGTWAAIAKAAGISPQTAFQRWSAKGRESHRKRQANLRRGTSKQ